MVIKFYAAEISMLLPLSHLFLRVRAKWRAVEDLKLLSIDEHYKEFTEMWSLEETQDWCV